MRLLSAAVAAVSLSVGLCGLAIGQSADVTLTKRAESAVVEAKFVLSKPTRRLRFPEGGDMRRLSWRLGEAAKMAGDGQSITFAQPVRSFTVELRPDVKDGQVDRVYIPVMPLNGGRAAAVYADYLLPRDGGSVRIAGEGVAFGRPVKGNKPIWGANDESTYLVVGAAGVKATDTYAITVDSQMPAWMAAALPKSVEAIMALYQTKFGSRPSQRPWIVASYEPADRPEQPLYRGDVSGHMIRLNLLGHRWQQPNDGLAYELNAFVAHELAHLWNHGMWQTAADQPVWLHEGGAEAMAHDALRTISGDNVRYAATISAKFMNCLNANGETLKEKTSRGGSAHYDCGTALFHMASALSSKDGSARPLDVLSAVFERQRGAKIYSVDDLVEVVRRSAPDANALNDLVRLISSDETWAHAIPRSGANFGIHAPGAKEFDQPVFAGKLLDNLLGALMKQDCDGGTSFGYDNQVYEVFSLPACKRIKENVVLTSLEGVNMQENPRTAVQHAVARCAAKQEVHLATQEGKELALPCEWTPPPIAIDG